MKKKVGLTVASVLAICLIGAGSYALACSGTCSSKSAEKASNTKTTSAVQAVTASGTTANANTTSCSANKSASLTNTDSKVCTTPCTAAERAACEAAGVKCVEGSASNAVMTSNDGVSSSKTCSAAEKAACEAAGYKCTTSSECSSKGASNAVMTSGSSCSSKGASNAVMTSGSSCSSKGASNAVMTSGSSCSAVKTAGASCSSTCSSKDASKASMTSATCSSKDASKASMASSSCSEAEKAACASAGKSCSSSCSSGAKKAGYAANVYKVENGMYYAVADGKKFVVTKDTPYTQVGNARYYFADDHCSVKCQEKMSSMALKYNHEAAALATNEANVKVVDGKKTASCCGQEFAVNSTTPCVVMDGQKVYRCSEKCAEHAMMASNIN